MNLNFSFDNLTLSGLLPQKKRAVSCSPAIARPSRDWLFLLFGFLVLFLLCAGAAVESYFLAKENEGGDFTGTNVQVQSTFDRAGLSELLVQFDARKDRRQQILSNPVFVGDPAQYLPAKSQ